MTNYQDALKTAGETMDTLTAAAPQAMADAARDYLASSDGTALPNPVAVVAAIKDAHRKAVTPALANVHRAIMADKCKKNAIDVFYRVIRKAAVDAVKAATK